MRLTECIETPEFLLISIAVSKMCSLFSTVKKWLFRRSVWSFNAPSSRKSINSFWNAWDVDVLCQDIFHHTLAMSTNNSYIVLQAQTPCQLFFLQVLVIFATIFGKLWCCYQFTLTIAHFFVWVRKKRFSSKLLLIFSLKFCEGICTFWFQWKKLRFIYPTL